MKVAIFSDIHSNLLVFEKAYEDAKNRGAETFLFLGDYVTDGFDANKIIEIIKNSNGYAINGNREVAIIDYHNKKNPAWDEYEQYWNLRYGYQTLSRDSIDYLNTLLIHRIITLNGKKISMAHSTPYSTKGIMLEDDLDKFDQIINDFDCDIYLFGHTHSSYKKKYRDKLLINVGSIGLPCDGLPFKYGMMTLTDEVKYEQIHIDYDYQTLEDYYVNSD